MNPYTFDESISNTRERNNNPVKKKNTIFELSSISSIHGLVSFHLQYPSFIPIGTDRYLFLFFSFLYYFYSSPRCKKRLTKCNDSRPMHAGAYSTPPFSILQPVNRSANNGQIQFPSKTWPAFIMLGQ